jgi:DNA-nicking Smr family endonuclease
MLDWTERRPEHLIDLHGLTVLQAEESARRFLQAQRKARPGAIVEIVTGRGRSGGGAPVRTRVRTLLRQLKDDSTVVRDFALSPSEGSFVVRLAG